MKFKENIVLTAVSGLGSGYSPKAPGTCGSLLYLALWLIQLHIFNFTFFFNFVFSVFLFLIAFLSCNYIVKNKLSDAEDPQFIVIDEWLGLSIPLIFLERQEYWLIALAFLLFRFFDIKKPWLVSKVEKYPGAWGIILDDVVAGVFALLVLLPLKFLL